MSKTLFERCKELYALHNSVYRTITALETLAPMKERSWIGTATDYNTITFDPTPYEFHENECVRQLAKNLSVLVRTYNEKGLETS
jgi:hypothetical protein